jgi:hypothetical protein
MAESSPRYRFGREAQTEEQTEHGTGYEGRTQNHYRDSWPIGNIRPVSADFFDSERMSTMVGLHGEEEGRAGGNAAGSPSKEEEDEEKRKEPSVLLLLAIFLSVFLAAVDISIITTALPTMAEHMNTSQKGFAWIGSAYLLAGAASEPIWAKVSDIFGRRPILMCANAVFLGGSVMCALSKHLGALLTGRVVQGLGSGGLLVLSNILIADLYSPRQVPSLKLNNWPLLTISSDGGEPTMAYSVWFGPLRMPQGHSLVAFSQKSSTGDGVSGSMSLWTYWPLFSRPSS